MLVLLAHFVFGHAALLFLEMALFVAGLIAIHAVLLFVVDERSRQDSP
jgi:hypothetical protein